MLKKILATSVVVGAVTLGAPIAHADPAQVDCGFNTIAQEDATGGQDTFTGGAYGFVVSGTPGNAVSIQCVVKVNGAPVANTGAPATGTTVAATAGQVTFTATDQDDVDLCAEWTDGTTSGESCSDTTVTQIPPQAVIDLLISVFDAIDAILIPIEQTVVDPAVCPVLATLGNTVPDVPGVLEINGQGDVFLLGDPFWDCPPYDLFD